MDLIHHMFTSTFDWHWAMQLGFWCLFFAFLTWGIAHACEFFEDGADYIGRNMPEGVKGATINAIGSSMPELWTTMALVFFWSGATALTAGVSVTAGSAIFNSDIIPMMSILAVTSPLAIKIFSLGAVSQVNKVDYITVDKKAILRDSMPLIFSEVVLIFMLGKPVLTSQDGLLLMGIYVVYALYLSWFTRKNSNKSEEKDEREFIVNDMPMNNKRAWKYLFWATMVIIVLCFFLGEGIMHSADALGINPMITALFIGAAASSVPDTILSVKDSMKGNYEDAISNAIGSNTFDICVALGLPLFLFTVFNGPIDLPADNGVQLLRIMLVVITVAIIALLTIPKRIRLVHAVILGLMYVGWVVLALNTEFNWFEIPFINELINLISLK